MLIEQAILIFQSTCPLAGQAAAAFSPGIDDLDRQEIARRGPAQAAFATEAADGRSIDFFRLPSGRYCVSQSTVSHNNHELRREPRIDAHFLVADAGVLAAFSNNALALLSAAIAQGHLRVLEAVPAVLEPFSLCRPVELGHIESNPAESARETPAVAAADARRADAAHFRFARAAHAPAGTATIDLQNDPSQIVGHECPAAIEKLEMLDDLVFETIAGKPGALAALRQLWPEVLAQVGPPLVDESREQYLRHALRVWKECVEGEQIRNPALALATMEVICLLFGDDGERHA